MDRYKEALEKARAEYEKAREQGYTWLMNLLEGMFPEMKESEDERVRKELIEQVEYIIPGKEEYDDEGRIIPTYHERIERYRAWLEKQKEQKFTEKQDYSDLTDLERAIHRGFLVVGVENVPVTIIKETAQDCLAWMKPQKGANGNEKMRGTCIDLLEHFPRPCGEVISPWKDCIAWLKFLRPPQYCENCKLKRSVENWKPSYEQMNALYDILHPADPVNMDAVKSLYNDLKAL